MRIPRLALCLCVLLSSAGVCRAGLYSPAEQDKEKLAPEYRQFRDTYLYFKNASNDALENPLRRKALLISSLVSALKEDSMSELQLLDVSAYLIRLQKHGEAITLLKEGIKRFPESFLLQANLGTAYFLQSHSEDENLLRLALDNLDEARDSWPANFGQLTDGQRQVVEGMGWQDDNAYAAGTWGLLLSPQGQGPWLTASALFAGRDLLQSYHFYRTVEKYQYRMVSWRRAKKGGLDPLFAIPGGAPVRYIGPSGHFEPGKLDPAEQEKLPGQSTKEALNIVEQLLIWMPTDPRLYWQLGELANADGSWKDALEIFTTLNKGGFTHPEFDAHLKVLQDHERDAKKSTSTSKTTTVPPPKPNPNPPDSTTEELWQDRWRFFGVGAGVGMVLTLFVGWQFRRLSRRRPRGVSV